MGWPFNPPSDAVALMLSPLAYFWGYLLLRNDEYKTLGTLWVWWTVLITFGLAFETGVVHRRWLLGLAGLALSIAETWVTWHMLSAKPPAGKT